MDKYKAKNVLQLGQIFNTEIKVDLSWFIVFFLITWSLASYYIPKSYSGGSTQMYWLLGLVGSLLFFSSVLAHELSHCLVARYTGIPVQGITLFLFGGMAQLTREPKRPRDEFWMALAGPAMSFSLTFLFGLVWLGIRDVNQPIAALVYWLARINLLLAVFNLIPGFPLDGGRVLRAIFWGINKDLRIATRIASFAGRAVAYLFILWGALLIFQNQWLNGMWVAFIGWFLARMSTSSYQQIVLRDQLMKHTAREAMMTDCTRVPAELTLKELVEDYVLSSRYRFFLVSVDDRVTGFITVDDIKEVPQEQWPILKVSQVKSSINQADAVNPDANLFTVLKLMSERIRTYLPVFESGEFLGMISRENVLSLIKIRKELRI